MWYIGLAQGSLAVLREAVVVEKRLLERRANRARQVGEWERERQARVGLVFCQLVRRQLDTPGPDGEAPPRPPRVPPRAGLRYKDAKGVLATFGAGGPGPYPPERRRHLWRYA